MFYNLLQCFTLFYNVLQCFLVVQKREGAVDAGAGNSIRTPTTIPDKIQYFKELVFAYMVIIDKILNDQVA